MYVGVELYLQTFLTRFKYLIISRSVSFTPGYEFGWPQSRLGPVLMLEIESLDCILTELWCGYINWFELAQGRVQSRPAVNVRMVLRFQLFTAACMAVTVIWDVAPCSLVVYRRFRDDWCLHHQGDQDPDDVNSKHLCNVGKLIPEYTAYHHKRQSSLR